MTIFVCRSLKRYLGHIEVFRVGPNLVGQMSSLEETGSWSWTEGRWGRQGERPLRKPTRAAPSCPTPSLQDRGGIHFCYLKHPVHVPGHGSPGKRIHHQALEIFFLKGYIINISNFTGKTATVADAQLCCCRAKAAMDTTARNGRSVCQ